MSDITVGTAKVESQRALVTRAVADTYELVVSSRTELADGVLGLELVDPNGEPLPWWDPGAHVDVTTPDGVVRQYSMCGDFGIAKSWRIGVLRAPDSRGGSESLHLKVQAGDRLIVGNPRNNFPLAPASSYLFIAGGIGITPILSMMRAAKRRGATMHLLYSGRRRDSMAFLDELTEFDPSEYSVVFSEEAGHPDLEALLTIWDAGTQIYCCGPSGMIQGLNNAAAKYPLLGVHVERFGALIDPALEAVPNEPFEVVLASTGEVLPVAADETLLEVLERRGVATVSSCLEGLCGTCEIGVLAGTPQHRDSILTEEERETCKWMMPCVSRCKGKSLTIDVVVP